MNDAAITDELLDDVRAAIDSRGRAYVAAKHVAGDVGAGRARVGRALSELEGEGELELYHEGSTDNLYLVL